MTERKHFIKFSEKKNDNVDLYADEKSFNNKTQSECLLISFYVSCIHIYDNINNSALFLQKL